MIRYAITFDHTRLEIVSQTSFSNNLLLYFHQNFNAKLSAFDLAMAEPFYDKDHVDDMRVYFSPYVYAAPERIMTGIFRIDV